MSKDNIYEAVLIGTDTAISYVENYLHFIFHGFGFLKRIWIWHHFEFSISIYTASW